MAHIQASCEEDPSRSSGEILPYARVHDERVERNALLVAVSEIPLVLGGLSELCYHQLY